MYNANPILASVLTESPIVRRLRHSLLLPTEQIYQDIIPVGDKLVRKSSCFGTWPDLET